MNISLADNSSLSSLWGISSKNYKISTSSGAVNNSESANNASGSSGSQNELLRVLKRVSETETTLENGDGDTAEISNSAMQAANGMPSGPPPSGPPPGPPPSENGNSGSSDDASAEASNQQNIVDLLTSDDDDDDDDDSDDSLQALLERASNGTADAADLQRLAILLEQRGQTTTDSAEKTSEDDGNKTKNNIDSADLAKDEYLKKTQNLPLETYSQMKNYSQYSLATNYNYTA